MASQPVVFPLHSIPSPDAALALWLCQLERDPDDVDAFAQCLSPEERTRAARFGTDALRNRWIVGRATLRLLLGSALGVNPIDIRLARGIRGRPELAHARSPDFNVSHTDGTAVIAIGHGLPADARVGVDIERADRVVNADGLARKFLTARERSTLSPQTADERRLAFLRLWTCKEAMSKATGDALSAPFRDIDVDIADQPRLHNGPAPYTPQDWRLFALSIDDGLIATAAIWKAS